VAFAGRSNVGKSSIINSLAGQQHLVRTSRTPGRTRALNFFEVRPGLRLVDLPGYGFARVSLAQRRAWGELMEGYLAQRQSLVGVLTVMDIRHPFKESDHDLLALLQAGGFRSHVVLNKADKLTRGEQNNMLRQARSEPAAGSAQVQLFSSVSGVGVDELRQVVRGWLE
jgi:GTP-binding protein